MRSIQGGGAAIVAFVSWAQPSDACLRPTVAIVMNAALQVHYNEALCNI